MLWIHITVCFLFMYFVSCAFMHWAIPTSARLLFRSMFFFDKSFFVSICYVVPPIHMWLMCHSRMCAPTNGFQQSVHSSPQSSQQKSAGGKSQLLSKQSSNGPSPVNFPVIDGYFKCYTYYVMALGWLKKEERRWTILTFDCFEFATVRDTTHIAITTAD